ncbi:mucin-2-like [Saccostrea cucullata]|uniref:mucin-2-like n=1 Tax=Saccostrea cuccullata TaxID=36930 RepID=UPI002ED62BA8
MKTMMATCMIFKLLFWSFLITVFMTNLNYGQSHLVTDTFSRQKETVLLKEILQLVKNQAKKMQTLERELTSINDQLSKCLSISRSFPSGRHDEEQQDTTTSLISRENSTTLETNPTIQLTSASDIPVVETEGETATRQDSLSTRDTATSAGISISRSFSSGRNDKEQQGTTTSLVSREQSTILETNSAIQLTSASDIPVVETEGETATRLDSLSTRDTATSADKEQQGTTTSLVSREQSTILETNSAIQLTSASDIPVVETEGETATRLDSLSTRDTATSAGTCGGTFYGQLSGYITSPNYPSSYPNYANCEWNIILPNGYGIKLLVIYFSTENYYDYVEILDPIRRTQIGRFSGTVAAGTLFYSNAESIVIKFSSDSSIQKQGFYLQFEPSTRPKIRKSATTTDTITETMEPITIAETTTEQTSSNVQFSTSIGNFTTTTDTIKETMEPITIAETKTAVSETITSPTSSNVQFSTSTERDMTFPSSTPTSSLTSTTTVTSSTTTKVTPSATTITPETTTNTPLTTTVTPERTTDTPETTTVRPLITQPQGTIGSRGDEFLILFMKNYPSAHGELTVYITTNNESTAEILTSTHLNANITSVFNFTSNFTLGLPLHLVCEYFTMEPKGLILRTSEISTVTIFDSFNIGSNDGTLIIPTQKLSNKYIVSSTDPVFTISDYFSQFAIGALHNKTNVEITFKFKQNTPLTIQGKSYRDGDVFTVMIERFETIQIAHTTDLSGSFITSTKPVAVFSGNRCKKFTNFCSHMVTQLPPTTEVDTQYIVPPFFHNSGTLIQVVSENLTFIDSSVGSIVSNFYLNEKGYKNIEVTLNVTTVIESNQPVLVTAFGMGDPYNPYMTVVPGIHQYLDYYKVTVPEGYEENFICVIIPSESLNNLRMNGFSASHYTSVYQSALTLTKQFSIRTFKVLSGTFVLSTIDASQFGLIVYGHRDADGYGFAGNFVYP